MAKKLTDAQRRALVHAKDNGSVDDRMSAREALRDIKNVALAAVEVGS